MPSLDSDLGAECTLEVVQLEPWTEKNHGGGELLERVARIITSHLEEEKHSLDCWFRKCHKSLLQALQTSENPAESCEKELRFEQNGASQVLKEQLNYTAMVQESPPSDNDENDVPFISRSTTFVHRFCPESGARGRVFHNSMINHVQNKRHLADKARVFLESVSHVHSSISPPDFFRKFVHSHAFHRTSELMTLTLVVVCGLEADLEMRSVLHHEDTPMWVLRASLFCNACFVIEVTLQILADGLVFFCGRDWQWNWFDTLLALFAVLDMCGLAITLSFLRLVRVSKIMKAFRVLRVLRLVGELRLLLSSVIKSMAALVWSLVLFMMITYLASICFTQGAAAHLAESPSDSLRHDVLFFYPDVPTAMYTLICSVTGGGDWRDAADTIFEVGSAYGVAFMLFVLIMVMGLMNVITAIFVEHASNIVSVDREFAIQQHLDQVESNVVNAMHIFRILDVKGEGALSLESLRDSFVEPRMAAYFSTFDMDVTEAEDVARLFFTDDKGMVNEHEFVLGCLSLQGVCKKGDLRIANYNFALHLSHVEKMLQDVQASIQQLRSSRRKSTSMRSSRYESHATDPGSVHE